MKRKVVFILPDLETGGAERIVTTIANHLPRDRFVPVIALLRKEGGYLEFLKDDIEVLDLKTQRIRHGILPILKTIRNQQPDIVFSGFGEVNAYLSIFLPFFRKTKFIARETNVVSQHVTRPEIKFFYKFYTNYNRIICQSNDMRSDLLANFSISQDNISKINNPVDFDFINEKLQNEEKPIAYDDAYKNVVAIGNLSSRKGFDNLLKVFSELKSEKIKLHILGDGRDKDILLQMKEELGLTNVIFHGQQKNPYPFLKFADLFVLSSRYEGFPNVLLEAGACGTYALANDCPGGINEIIQPKINGEIATIENYNEFATKIAQLVHLPYDKNEVVQSIKSRFSKEIIMKKYEDLLSTI